MRFALSAMALAVAFSASGCGGDSYNEKELHGDFDVYGPKEMKGQDCFWFVERDGQHARFIVYARVEFLDSLPDTIRVAVPKGGPEAGK